MISFRQFLLENFKISTIIKVSVSSREIDVSCDKIGKKINFLSYIDTFPKSRENFKGIIFSVKDELYNICFNEDLTHVRILELLKPKLPNLRLLYIYNATYHTEAGEKMLDDWAFSYKIVDGVLTSAFEEDTLQELEKQKKISKVLGFSPTQWQNIVDNRG